MCLFFVDNPVLQTLKKWNYKRAESEFVNEAATEKPEQRTQLITFSQWTLLTRQRSSLSRTPQQQTRAN
jgi:hypothetical protein